MQDTTLAAWAELHANRLPPLDEYPCRRGSGQQA